MTTNEKKKHAESVPENNPSPPKLMKKYCKRCKNTMRAFHISSDSSCGNINMSITAQYLVCLSNVMQKRLISGSGGKDGGYREGACYVDDS
jgi:hypothetical protein